MPLNIDATDFGYVSMLRDEPINEDLTRVKVGGYCVVGVAVGAMVPGNVVVVDTTVDDGYSTTTSANSTSVAGYVVAGDSVHPNMWDYTSDIVTGQKILVLIKGVVLATTSTSVTRGALVGTSTTAGAVVTTSTANAGAGKALQTAVGAAQIRVLV